MNNLFHASDLDLKLNEAERDKIRHSVQESALFTPAYALMNGLSAVVASYGLLADSTAVVIGAMLIAMLLGPISGMAMALVDGNNALLKRALVSEALGVILVLVIAFLIGTFHRELPLTREILARTSPNILDLMIALAGGAAGSYAVISPKVGAGLVGVAISTALVPPLAVCGISMAHGEPRLALGAFLLFFTNLVAIQIASSLVMMVQGFHKIRFRSQNLKQIALRNGPSLAMLAFLVVILGLNFQQTLAKQQFERNIRTTLIDTLQHYPGVDLAELRFARIDDIQLVIAVLRTPVSFTPERVREIAQRLPVFPGTRLELHIRSIITKEATEYGYLHVPSVDEEEQTSPSTRDAPELKE